MGSSSTLSTRSVGYTRISTSIQDTAAQVAALKASGCEQVFSEQVSTRVPDSDREQLQACLKALQPGDELVLAKLDRLGRPQVEVIVRLNDLQQQGIHVRTLDGLINTAALGKMAPLVVGLLTGLAEVERELIRERTLEFIEHRRATGGDLGGRRKSYSPEQPALVRRLRAEGESVRSVSKSTGLSLATIDRIIKLATAD